MKKDELVSKMVELLQQAMESSGEKQEEEAGAESALLGADAVLSSLGLVSYIVDVESMLDEEYSLELTLVTEEALSRSKSPFRTPDTLADYILELAAAESGATEGGEDEQADTKVTTTEATS